MVVTLMSDVCSDILYHYEDRDGAKMKNIMMMMVMLMTAVANFFLGLVPMVPLVMHQRLC